MEKKKGRGRPTVTEKMMGGSAEAYEKIIMGGKRRCSRRTISDTAYAFAAAGILSEAASEIEDLEVLADFRPESEYMCRSILNQLGRMAHGGFSKEFVIIVAKAAIGDRKNGYSVKEIERYIRNGRLTGEW